MHALFLRLLTYGLVIIRFSTIPFPIREYNAIQIRLADLSLCSLTVLCARMLVTGWSAYAVWRTKHIEQSFNEIIINPNTPCSVNLSPDYFKTRTAYEVSSLHRVGTLHSTIFFQIPDLILNCTALVLCSYLSFTLLRVSATYTSRSTMFSYGYLFQLYKAQSFKCVGAPLHIVRIYKVGS